MLIVMCKVIFAKYSSLLCYLDQICGYVCIVVAVMMLYFVFKKGKCVTLYCDYYFKVLCNDAKCVRMEVTDE